ncbi:MAG: DUF3293 domain-containing protein [Pleurocapsa sp. SU_196_0]|nr:DUF3293 domain-containing protein [Pleurocapsa sp. SU_196_0]
MTNDLPDSDPKNFRAAYLETMYTANDVSFRFTDLEPGVTLYDGRRFSLITAANPRSEALSDARNDALNLEMKSCVLARGWAFTDSLGHDPTGTWREPGFLIWDAALEDVLALGRDFGQNAIVYGRIGTRRAGVVRHRRTRVVRSENPASNRNLASLKRCLVYSGAWR